MATLEQLYKLRNNTDFRNRIAAACWKKAKAIIVEDALEPSHDVRMLWAQEAVLDDGSGSAIRRVVTGAMVLHEDDADGATDAQLEATVGTVVDKLAV